MRVEAIAAAALPTNDQAGAAGKLVANVEALDGLVVDCAAGRGPRRWEGPWVGRGDRRGRAAYNDQAGAAGELVATVEAIDRLVINPRRGVRTW